MIVTKCCFCCSLKYGYLTYGVICMILRICVVTILYFLMPIFIISYHSDLRNITKDPTETLKVITSGFGFLIGWFIATSATLFFALKGIIQERSILMFPYIIVLIVEVTFASICNLIGVATVSWWFLFDFFVIGAINIYAAICLVSLYQQLKLSEKGRPMGISHIG